MTDYSLGTHGRAKKKSKKDDLEGVGGEIPERIKQCGNCINQFVLRQVQEQMSCVGAVDSLLWRWMGRQRELQR